MMNRILIAAPIGGKKQYSILDWLNWIAAQDYPKDLIEVCVCVNGKDNEEVADLFRQTSINYQDGTKKEIITLVLPESSELSVIQKITYSREMIRRYAVEKEFDYIFFLDTDTIPFSKDVLRVLLNHEKEVISGLYCYKNTKQPVIIDKDTNTNISFDKCKELVKNEEITEVWGFGFGCLLLDRSAFKNNAFDYDLFGEERTDDFGYCHVLEHQGIKRWFDPVVLCKHLVDPCVSPKEHGTKLPFMIK